MSPRRNRTFPYCRHSGFSLLEAVIVVVIVAVLAAFLLPVVVHARRQAVRSQCGANLHQLGAAVATYSVASRFNLPTHHVNPDISFDTFGMCLSDGENVNLGLLVDYVGSGSTLYCPSQTADRSPDIAYDSTHNRWRWHGQNQPPGPPSDPGGPGGQGDPGDPDAVDTAGLNSSYATRCRSQSGRSAAWTLLNYSNKVIYSDFIGVDDWPGRGRLPHGLRGPHDSQGYNRLFGDGSVLWADSARINDLRPVGPEEPTMSELLGYYELLDILP